MCMCHSLHIPMLHNLGTCASLPQNLDLKGMFAVAAQGDGFRLFEVLKRAVFDVSA